MDPDMTLPIIELRISSDLPDYFQDRDSVSACFSRALKPILDTLMDIENAGNFVLGVTLTNDSEIRIFNLKHRNQDKATDVLSFPLLDDSENPDDILPDGPPVMLGDVVISMETVMRQADERKMRFIDRLAECFTHGVLHLLGYNHNSEDDRLIMENLEDKLVPGVIREFEKYTSQA